MNSTDVRRRNFLKNSVNLLTFLPLYSLKDGFIDFSKKYRVGLIGAGWYGKSDLFRMMQVIPTEVVALCDVNKKTLHEAAFMVQQRGNNHAPKLYLDYRKMIAENSFDIIIIGTPDHWHALMAIAALKAGAHVYLQKPVSVDVLEGEAIVRESLSSGRKVQVGLQRRSTPHILKAKKEILDSKVIGEIHHVEMCCYYHMRDQRNLPPAPVPDYLDWDMYCGPAPLLPYNGIGWRAFKEFGNGIMGDMCVHMYDTARWLLGLKWPKKITSAGGIYLQKSSNANTADTQIAIFEHDDLNCVWTHRSWGTAPDPDYPWALFIYGEHGTLKISTLQAEYIPIDKAKNKIVFDVIYEKTEYPSDLFEALIELHSAPATRAHFINLINSIEKENTLVASISESHISTASCILANLSMETGRSLLYDPILKVVKNDAEASKLLSRSYRDPWQHPYYST